MARLLHWKTTAAMAAVYAALAAPLLYFIRDATVLVAVLFVLFALVLLAGNIYVRAKDKAQGARRTVEDRPEAGLLGRDDRRSSTVAQGKRDDGNGDRSSPLAPRAVRLDPEAGRR